MKLILVGPPGAGKSTIGKLLAKELAVSFVDTDVEIEKRSSRTISEIFLEDGEAKFREIEKEVVLSVLTEGYEVIALGGGAILDQEIFGILRNEPLVIYLQVSISNAAPRVGFNNERPLLLANPRQQWLKLFEARREKYEALAKYNISTDNRKPKEVVGELLAKLSLRTTP